MNKKQIKAAILIEKKKLLLFNTLEELETCIKNIKAQFKIEYPDFYELATKKMKNYEEALELYILEKILQ